MKSPLAKKVAALKAAYDAPVLVAAAAALEQARERLIDAEDRFAQVTLEDRLIIGLHCLKAHDHFAVTDPGKRNPKGRNQHSGEALSRRDKASALGTFEGWLGTRLPWLKRPTAYKYMSAARGLGASAANTEQALRLSLADLREKHLAEDLPPVSIASLARAALPLSEDPPGDPPPAPEQSEFEFLKDILSHYREQSETVLSHVERIRANPTVHRAACARAYADLAALTGQQWAPSDQPDELASVDPDHIDL